MVAFFPENHRNGSRKSVDLRSNFFNINAVFFLISFAPQADASAIKPAAAFDCGEIVGKVFHDVNRNAIHDAGEPGLPGVSLISLKGTLTKTDEYEKFHVGCTGVAYTNYQVKVVLKLDAQTLPSGYYLTDKEPRVGSHSHGMISKLNFAALLAPLVQIDLQDGAFENDSGSLKTQWVDGIEKLISILNKEPSALRMTYYVGEEKMLLARKRMAILKRIIESRRKQTLRHDQLPVEIRIVQLK